MATSVIRFPSQVFCAPNRQFSSEFSLFWGQPLRFVPMVDSSKAAVALVDPEFFFRSCRRSAVVVQLHEMSFESPMPFSKYCIKLTMRLHFVVL